MKKSIVGLFSVLLLSSLCADKENIPNLSSPLTYQQSLNVTRGRIDIMDEELTEYFASMSPKASRQVRSEFAAAMKAVSNLKDRLEKLTS